MMAILLSTLTLQEAQDSSEIENIITTQDALYKYQLQTNTSDLAAKEVSHYANGLSAGYQCVKKHGLLTINAIQDIHAEIEQNRAGFRKVPGTVLKNEQRQAAIEHLQRYLSETPVCFILWLPQDVIDRAKEQDIT